MELQEESIVNQTDVSLSLAKHVISTHAKNANLVFSPLSLHVLLGLVASGSNGPTRDQLLGFLKSKSTEELNSLSSQMATEVLADGGPLGGPCLSFANGVWIDRSVALKPTFKKIVKNDYMAASKRVDFRNKAYKATKKVNAWAERKTNGLIKQVVPPDSVNAYTRLILANAVYFKGAWDQKFNSSMTKKHDFFLINGTSVRAPLMTSFNDQYVDYFDGFKVLRLPYKRGKDKKRRFSMYMFLPDAKDGLPSLIYKVSSEPGFIENHLPDEKVAVKDFRIPKFKIDFDFEASKVLKAQGVVLPFREGGLTEMVDDPIVGRKLYVSSIFHKSFIEVNEEGTEAAAASACHVMKVLCYKKPKKPKDFVADHPFMFVIREDSTGVLLFIGQLLNPLAG